MYSDDKDISESFDHFQKNSISCFTEFFFIAATLVFRIASICLLLWVFMVSYISITSSQFFIFQLSLQDQWQQVSPSLPTLVIIPPLYLLVLVLLNTCTYFICFGSNTTSTLWALLSILVPRPVKTSFSSARQLLVINIACNSLVHAFLWAAMIGTCSQCSLYLSLSSLSVAWPTLLVLGILSILASFPYYYFTIRPTRPLSVHPKTSSRYVVSTSL